MKKGIALILIVLFSQPSFSQLLWEIKGNGLKHSSFLLATNNIISQDFLDTIPNVYACFEKSECVVTEFEMQDFEALSSLRVAALLPDSTLLTNYFTSSDYNLIQQQIEFRLGIPMHSISRMKPAYIVALYRTEIVKQHCNYDETRTLNTFFPIIASSKKIPVYGLDTKTEALYMIFDKEPINQQIKELIHIIRYPDDEIKIETDLLAMYRQGRLNDMAYRIQSPDNQSTLSFSDYQAHYLRNKEWVKRLSTLMLAKRCFITLNAIYLGGDKGLIQLLREQGYTVQAYNKKTKLSHITFKSI